MAKVAIIGTGFVADLYVSSLRTFPSIEIVGAFDINPSRLNSFCQFWKIKATESMEELLAEGSAAPDLVLNLTNPHAHYEVSHACLSVGRSVYSEKPLAMTLDEASVLCELANERGLQLSSAPCSVLGESAQAVWKALREDRIGTPRLIYAELDDDFIPKAPYMKWSSQSGAPWPAQDEFEVGCTLEHAGYYLTWLMAMFGPIRTVVAASAHLLEAAGTAAALHGPDFSSAILFFHSGVVARLTCSIIAPPQSLITYHRRYRCDRDR